MMGEPFRSLTGKGRQRVLGEIFGISSGLPFQAGHDPGQRKQHDLVLQGTPGDARLMFPSRA